MDLSGAVDLSVRTIRLDLPPPMDRDQEVAAAHAAYDAGWNSTPAAYAQAQVVRLAVASILSARLLHVRKERFGAFGLVGNPEVVTVRQLAALHRPHRGTAGQAFELAVSDAVEAGEPFVCDKIRKGLRLLGVRDEGRCPW